MYEGVFIFFFRAGVVRRVGGANLVSLPVRTKNAMQRLVPRTLGNSHRVSNSHLTISSV